MATKKIYAVRNGRKTGLFSTWPECQRQVTGYPGAEYKSFVSAEEARKFLAGAEESAPSGNDVGGGCFGGGTAGMSGADFFASQGTAGGADYRDFLREPGTAVAYVDGSYDKASGDFSCGVVFLYEGQEEHYGERYSDRELAAMRNVAGEIKGSETAMRIALEKGVEKLVIYHDYEGIAKWCNGAWKANKEGTKAYQSYYREVRKRLPVAFVKVKGHSGDHYNDKADELAKNALYIRRYE